MVKPLITNFLSPLIFTFTFFVFAPSLCTLCSPSPTDLLSSCLNLHEVKNFTLLPTPDRESASQFYELLNFSIQNLRFEGLTTPKPLAIILPDSKEELATSVLCCRKTNLSIRARCGGHSYEGTSSVAFDGAPFAIIDMMNLNRVSIDSKLEMAWVEGGATLGQTYFAISQYSDHHGFSAGSCPTVGVGGHIGGGGFGLLSRKYGLAADNVVDALLVDAEGRLLDRKGMGEDVFWAIRGGGGGIWGIVYAWKIQLLKVPPIITGFVVSRPGTKRHVAKLVHKWQYVAPKLEDEFYLSVFVGAGLPEAKRIGRISATFKGFYLGPKREALSILSQSFPQLGITEEECTEMNWIESVVYFSGLKNSTVTELKNRYLQDKGYFKAKSDYVRKLIGLRGIKLALDILEKEPKGYVILDPYGGTMDHIGSEAIAFPHRKGNLFTIQYLVEWKKEDDKKSSEYIEWVREFYNSMEDFVSTSPRAAYVNYLDLDLGVMETAIPSGDAVEIARVWGEKYFLSNYDRLVRAKTLIDPNNIFNYQQGIPPSSSDNSKAEI